MKGYFGNQANNIYRRKRVKNSDILELFIYFALTEEDDDLNSKERDIFYDVASYYYKEGQRQAGKKKPSPLSEVAFLTLMSMPNSAGYTWEEYKGSSTLRNVYELYRLAVQSIQQGVKPDAFSDLFKQMIQKQQNRKLKIKDGKISGYVDLTIIGINNEALAEGMLSVDSDAKVKFIAVMDDRTTNMCESLDGQVFNVHGWNEFKRYSASNMTDKTYKCYGLVLGLNLPPIDDHFHWCRSTIEYIKPVENNQNSEYNTVNYIRKKGYTTSRVLDDNIKKAISLLPKNIQKLIGNTKINITNKDSYYDRKNDVIYLLKDSNKYEVLHEIGHAIETKLDIIHDRNYIDIQKNGLNIKQIQIGSLNGYNHKYQFWLESSKFISEYQRRVYENDIDNNPIVDYSNYTFNSKTLGEYFSEGFRCYFENNRLLMNKDIDLYNYIKEILK